ncbi:acyl--CoA ligase [Phanerochaete sordida]|uniref:Acyl--CoA ligase n=1 Tax=Phanerochaete sordida TaxID=48140 RepID=A0A9P3L993_9APHY|nr:acyl--CoA ligase [Phanerochaete sordida]
MSFRTHISVLDKAATLHASRPVFRVPKLKHDSEQVEEWDTVTYSRFASDVERYAKYWTKLLDGIALRSVVALWLGGMTYIDVLHIYGIFKAGFIPQLFSLRLPNPDVVNELLQKAGAKALIYDPSYESAAPTFSVPVYPAPFTELPDVDDVVLPSTSFTPTDDDVAMVFHTSGSTSGSPKLVRCTYKWLDCIVSKGYIFSIPKDEARQDVTVWMGSMCHIGQTCMLIGSLQHGSCVIQPTKIAFSSDELIDMITRCGLNRLNQFATFLATHLKHSRQDAKLLALMQGLDEVLYSGLALAAEEERWAYEKGIRLTNLFGNTECGAMLLSVGGNGPDARWLRPIPGTDYGFFPIADGTEGDAPANANAQLCELVILAQSGDCPDAALRAADGHYHTGDLFQAAPGPAGAGAWVARGRNDDWIKSENSLRCDTRAIEDNVRQTCGDLVEHCVVVGNGRPSPALFVEARAGLAPEQVRRDILRRTRHFHARRYLHERVTAPELVFVVAPGTLPRTATKGNIRRRAVEDKFQAELDKAYGVRS